jgi:hypothetical protein
VREKNDQVVVELGQEVLPPYPSIILHVIVIVTLIGSRFSLLSY